MLFLAREKLWPFDWFWVKPLRFSPSMAGRTERKSLEPVSKILDKIFRDNGPVRDVTNESCRVAEGLS